MAAAVAHGIASSLDNVIDDAIRIAAKVADDVAKGASSLADDVARAAAKKAALKAGSEAALDTSLKNIGKTAKTINSRFTNNIDEIAKGTDEILTGTIKAADDSLVATVARNKNISDSAARKLLQKNDKIIASSLDEFTESGVKLAKNQADNALVADVRNSLDDSLEKLTKELDDLTRFGDDFVYQNLEEAGKNFSRMTELKGLIDDVGKQLETLSKMTDNLAKEATEAATKHADAAATLKNVTQVSKVALDVDNMSAFRKFWNTISKKSGDPNLGYSWKRLTAVGIVLLCAGIGIYCGITGKSFREVLREVEKGIISVVTDILKEIIIMTADLISDIAPIIADALGDLIKEITPAAATLFGAAGSGIAQIGGSLADSLGLSGFFNNMGSTTSSIIYGIMGVVLFSIVWKLYRMIRGD